MDFGVPSGSTMLLYWRRKNVPKNILRTSLFPDLGTCIMLQSSHGVTVSTLDFESSDGGSNPPGSCFESRSVRMSQRRLLQRGSEAGQGIKTGVIPTLLCATVYIV